MITNNHQHSSDCHCTVEDDICIVCLTLHGDPCPDCGGRGFHTLPCVQVSVAGDAGDCPYSEVEVHDVGLDPRTDADMREMYDSAFEIDWSPECELIVPVAGDGMLTNEEVQ